MHLNFYFFSSYSVAFFIFCKIIDRSYYAATKLRLNIIRWPIYIAQLFFKSTNINTTMKPSPQST
jgi:hypothetical protein